MPAFIRDKFFNRYLPLTLSALLLMAAGGAWFLFSRAPAKPFSISEAAAKIEIPQSYQQPLVVSMGNSSLTVAPVDAAQSQAVQEDNQYTYHNVYPNTDAVETKNKYKIKEELQFRQAGHPTEFKYQIANSGQYRIEKDGGGNYIFYAQNSASADLGRLFTIPAPFVQDARGNHSTEAVTSSITDGLLTVSIDKNWLEKAVYPVILDPIIEINILNVHSHPSQGQNWEVDFTTQGQADLEIIPNDQATINDDQFVGLWCGDTQVTPQITEDHAIFYQNWPCDNTAKVIFYTQTAGNHTLRFDFGGQTAYAYNSAPALSGVTIRGGVKVTGGTGIVTKIAWTCGKGTVTDSDGNFYNTVLIGTQCWMAENLRTTKKPDGTSLTEGSGMYSNPGYYGSPWGRLYDWATAMNISSIYNSSSTPWGGVPGLKIQGICPAGWHVPSDYGSNPTVGEDFTKLVSYAATLPSCSGSEGGCLKEDIDYTYWNSSNTGATNSSNFTGIPAGNYTSGFFNRGYYAYFWSSYETNPTTAYYRRLSYSTATVNRSITIKSFGLSVRCVKD